MAENIFFFWVNFCQPTKADNLAWFPHSTLDEVLFIIKISDTKINGSGNDILHTFRKQMKKDFENPESDSQMETEKSKSDNDSDSDVDPV